jgi:hypothetical protein
MNIYDSDDYDPWQLLVDTVKRSEKLENTVLELVAAHRQHSEVIQQLLHQNQQLSKQAKELADYVTRKSTT